MLLRMASSQRFKMTLVTKWDFCTLHMVPAIPKYSQLQHTNKFIGIGALTAPLSATRFAQLTNWSTHYLVSLFLSLLNVIILARVFRFQSQDGMSMGQ